MRWLHSVIKDMLAEPFKPLNVLIFTRTPVSYLVGIGLRKLKWLNDTILVVDQTMITEG